MSKLEREVVRIWERDVEELRQHAAALSSRADRNEAEKVSGLSLHEAALRVIIERQSPPTYFELFNVLQHKQAASMNIVQFYHAMRRSALVRMNGIHVVKRRN